MLVHPSVNFGVLPVDESRGVAHTNLETDLVTNEDFEFLNGPFPELELVLGSRGICTEVRIEQDLVQQHVVSKAERRRKC